MALILDKTEQKIVDIIDAHRSSELPESPDWHIYVPGCGAHPVPR